MKLLDIYNGTPIFVQNLACSYEGFRIQKKRYSKQFWKIYNKYIERNNWKYEQLCEYRDERLRKIIKYSYKMVPYYTKMFNSYGINPESIKCLEDLKIIPILTKQMIIEKYEDFISRDVKKNSLIKLKTSGTTGAALKIYCNQSVIHEQYSAFWRARRNVGIQFGMRQGTFGGQDVVPRKQCNPPYWRFNVPGNQIYFSVYHLNDRSIENYISTIEIEKIQWIHSYPSAINLLAQYIVENNRRLSSSLKFITTGSENLRLSQKETICKAFGCPIFQHYGQAENVAIFSENRESRIFIDEDFSAVELVKNTGFNNYRVIGSSLNNFVMPLLRYDIGDVVEFTESLEGREILSIDGRQEDYIVLSDGTKIGRLAHVFSNTTNIIEAQIIQKKVGEIIIKVIKSSEYHIHDELELIKNLRSKLGNEIDINIYYVDEIERSKNGKLRFIVSDL